MLKINNEYKPVITVENDEVFRNGVFSQNISRIIDYIEQNEKDIIIERIIIDDYSTFSVVNEDHLPSVDITKPVVLAEINPGKYNLIDGNHRIVKAHRCIR